MKESYASMMSIEEMMEEEETLQYLHYSETLKQEKKVAYEMEEGQVSLFVNDKEGNDKRPDFRGEGLFKGEKVVISLWKKTSKKGTNYLSGQIQEPYNGSGSRKGGSVSATDVPF